MSHPKRFVGSELNRKNKKIKSPTTVEVMKNTEKLFTQTECAPFCLLLYFNGMNRKNLNLMVVSKIYKRRDVSVHPTRRSIFAL
jgi:hypothetical protein